MNLPNKITIGRIVLTAVFMFFLFMDGLTFKILSVCVYVAAVISDYLDGMIAKKTGEISNLGKFLDPVADKILVLGAFLAFIEMKLVPGWMVLIIILREILITGLRIAALMGTNEVIPAGKMGKHKTVSQMSAIFIILLVVIYKETYVNLMGKWGETSELWSNRIIFVFMLITVIMTIGSGVSYLMGNKKYLLNGREDSKKR